MKDENKLYHFEWLILIALVSVVFAFGYTANDLINHRTTATVASSTAIIWPPTKIDPCEGLPDPEHKAMYRDYHFDASHNYASSTCRYIEWKTWVKPVVKKEMVSRTATTSTGYIEWLYATSTSTETSHCCDEDGNVYHTFTVSKTKP